MAENQEHQDEVGELPIFPAANTTQDVSLPSPVDDLELPVLRRRDTNELVPSSVAWTASTHGDQTASRKLGPFERTLLDVFEKADTDDSGTLTSDELLKIFSAPPLQLGLSDEEIKKMHDMADVDNDGHVSYREFVPICREMLVRVYSQGHAHDNDKPGSEWMELYSEKEGWMYLNKQTGASTYEMPSEMMKIVQTGDLLADVMIDVLRHVFDSQAAHNDTIMDVLWAQAEELAHLKAKVPMPSDWGSFNLKDWCETLSSNLLEFCATQPLKPRYWIYIRQVVRGGMIWYNKQTGNIQHEPLSAILDALHRLNQEEDITEHHSALRAVDAEKDTLAKEQAEIDGANPGANRPAAREIKQLEHLLSEAQSELEKTEQDHSTLQSAYEAAKEHRNADQAEIAILEDTRQKFESELNDAKSAHADEKAALSQMVREQQSQIAALDKQLKERQEALAMTQATLDKLTQEIKDVRRQKRVVTATSAEAESINSLRQKYEQLLADHAKVRQTCETRNKQIRIVRAQLGDTKDKNSSLNRKAGDIGKIERRLTEITEAHATAKAFLHAKTQLLHARERELSGVKKRLQDLESREKKRTELLHSALDRDDRGSPARPSPSRSAGRRSSSPKKMPELSGSRPTTAEFGVDARVGSTKRSSRKPNRRHSGRSKALPALAPLPPDMEPARSTMSFHKTRKADRDMRES